MRGASGGEKGRSLGSDTVPDIGAEGRVTCGGHGLGGEILDFNREAMVDKPCIPLLSRRKVMSANEDLVCIGGRVTQHVSNEMDNVDCQRTWRWPEGPRGREHPTEPQWESQGGPEEERLRVGAGVIQNSRRCDRGNDLLETYFM